MAEREFSAGGIVIRRIRGVCIKVLLIKDSYGHWTWPKGKIDKGESAVQAAIREIGEETGLTEIEVKKEIGRTQYFYRLKGKLIFKTVYMFLFELKKPQRLEIQTEEIETGKWFSDKEAIGRVDYRGSKETLKEAIKIFKREEKRYGKSDG